MDADDNHRGWTERSGSFSPGYYAQISLDEVSETFTTVFEHYAAEDTSVLELGCSSGRHLVHLHGRDYKDITGIDINDDSFGVMAEYFPELVDTGTFLTGAIEDLLPDFPDDKFDVTYSIKTLQRVYPDDTWVFREIARVSPDLVIIAGNEDNSPTRGRSGSKMSYVSGDFPLYHRNWEDEFSEFGLTQLLCEPGKCGMVHVSRVL